MRDDIVGMLKNAIDHGGNPNRVAQSLVNSGYPLKDVKEALDYVISQNPQAQQTPQGQNQIPQMQLQATSNQSPQTAQQQLQSERKQMPTPPQYKAPMQQNIQAQKLQPLKPKPLPSSKTNPAGNGKIIALIAVLVLLIASLVSVIIFKDEILDLLSLWV